MQNIPTNNIRAMAARLDAIDILRAAQNQTLAYGPCFRNEAWLKLNRIMAYIERQ